MRIYHSQLNKQLQKKLDHTFLVFGDEPWQKNDALAQIKLHAKQQGYDELIRFSNDEHFNFHDLLNEFNSMSLFSSLRIIEIDMGNNKVNEQSSKVLTEIAELQATGQSDVMLILHGNKLDASSSKKKWFKTLEKQGCYIPLYDLEGKGLTIWLSQQCQRLNLNLSADAQRMLIDFFAGNIPALAQEMEKLMLLYNQQYIDANHLESLLIRQSKFTPFQLTDALLAGELSKVNDMLTQMKHEGVVGAQLIWALHNQLSQLEQMQTQLSQGSSFNDVMKQFKVWDKKKPLYQNALKQVSINNIKQAKKRLGQVDLISKTASDFDPFLLLSDVCISVYFADGTQALALDYDMQA
ncbi:DNA polymerase III subunit delta [Thalassotalea sp. HSM 43]|uniref:DNA polymerase III subunit delta n=1 Tax=Thalassotalea sp. HSM 43 TaxID=2552945 RepID=UPI001080E79E|nr:DNA polymerase III subunit delta [Thalassotalea sp. HSM 43]QBY05495.1 DNA polymerase III subunit delta [Thalassotalea sp. HSM 43]